MSVTTLVSESRARQLSRLMPDQDLVAWADEIARELERGRMENQQVKSQISRAFDGAKQSPAVSLFTAWVRYQRARETASRLWKSSTRLGGQPMDVADAVVTLVDRIHNRLKEAAEDTDDTALVERATMLATARLMGFFRRSMVVELERRGREQRERERKEREKRS